MTTATINRITVYWDTQDSSNEGWAYSATGDDITASGPIGGVAANDLANAIAETCRILDCGADPQDFAIGTEDGGYACWDRA